MKTMLRAGRLGAVLTSLALCVALGLLAGCGDTKKQPTDKGKKAADKDADTKKVTPKEEPKTPAKPEEPAKPAKPAEPKDDVPAPPKVNEPAEPAKPAEPAEPMAKPEEPAKPAEPAKPEEPAKPAEPKVEEPAKPAEPAKPEEPAKPAEPMVKPEEPAKPAEPSKPEEPAKPAEPKVEEPAKPAEPPKPEEPKKPEEPAKPAEPTVKPAEPPKPTEMAAKPDEPAKPAPAAAGDVKVSAFAPAEDLANQVEAYIKRLTEYVETEAAYKDSEASIAKDANTMCVVALALGLHDQDSKYKKNAPALLKACQDLAAAKSYDAAKKAVEAVAKAADQGGEGPALKWEKVASLPELMKAVPVINTKLKRNTDPRRFKSKAKDTAGFSAVIAAIGQASIADLSETKNPDEVAKWQKYCIEMRDEAGALNAAIRKGDEAAAKDIMPKLAKSCDDCHETFHKEALGKSDVEEK